ncbi:MAG: tellurite resistance TerB family protein [Cyanobium sp.]
MRSFMVSTSPTLQLSSPADAFAAIALAAVACDGELAALEARRLRQQLEYRQPYCRYDDQAMATLLDRLLLILREQGCEALMGQAAPLLGPQQRETALAVAADLTRADHVETGAEHRFLIDLAERLQIDAERSAQILEVIALLNGDSLAG